MRSSSLLITLTSLLTACGQGNPQEQLPAEAARNKDTLVHQGTPLAQYVVEAFADDRGTVWFGTMEHGMASYNGNELAFFPGTEGLIVANIAQDAEGRIWFAGHDGTGLRHFDPAVATPEINTVWTQETSVATDRSGTVWVGTRAGILHQEGDRFVPFPLPFDRSTIGQYAIVPGRASLALEDSHGNLWFRTDGAGAIRYKDGTFTQFTKEHGLCSNMVNGIVEDDQGRLWIICMQGYQPKMTHDGGLCRLEDPTVATAEEARFTTFPDTEGLHHNDLYTLFKDSGGAIWIGATGRGAYRYQDGEFTLFDRTDRPDLNASFGLQGMAEDAQGRLWCGFSGGLFRLDEGTFKHMPREGPWE